MNPAMKTKEKTPNHRPVTERSEPLFSLLDSLIQVEFLIDCQPSSSSKSGKTLQIPQVSIVKDPAGSFS